MGARVKEPVAREREFYDAWAGRVDPEKIKVEQYFEASTCPENRYLLKSMGDIRGASILELGCGAGENSVYFSLMGANCLASDCSEGMLELVQSLASRYQVKLKTQVMDAMDIPYPDNHFDFVYTANTLHHVDFEMATREIHRVLRKDGKLLSWDPLRHNPVINIYRRMATKVRTADEKPLDINVVAKLKRLFSRVEYDTFWLATLWLFICFFLVEKIHPNDEPYWKKIVTDEPRLRARYLKLERIDKFLKKLGFLKRFAWNIAIVATK